MLFTMKNLEWKKVGWILNFLLKYYKTNNMIEIGEIWKGFSFTILQQAAGKNPPEDKDAT